MQRLSALRLPYIFRRSGALGSLWGALAPSGARWLPLTRELSAKLTEGETVSGQTKLLA